MVDIASGLSAATQALKLTKDLRDIDREVDKADLKIQLVDLTDRLLDAKEALQDAKQERNELFKEIEDLKDKLNIKGQLSFENGLLYHHPGNSLIEGPYCNQCYVSEGRFFNLLETKKENRKIRYHCTNCQFWNEFAP